MVDTVHNVFERLTTFRTRAARATSSDGLVDEAARLLDAFQDTEAQHVQLGLDREDFAFSAAQAELRSARLRFCGELRQLQRRVALSEPERSQLRRLDTLASRAPLTSAADLEIIRAGRLARV